MCYEKAGILGKEMSRTSETIFEVNDRLNLINSEKLKEIMKTENLLKEGFVFRDLQYE